MTDRLPTECWNEIGVFSRETPSCERLQTVIHCRNCDVFNRAGRRLLERQIPDRFREEWSRTLLTEKPDETPGTESVMVFRIGGEYLAVRTDQFEEVIDPENMLSTIPQPGYRRKSAAPGGGMPKRRGSNPYHSLPHNRNSVLLGIINVHGEVQLCISLKHLLDIKARDSADGETRAFRRMVVLRFRGEKYVSPVDEIFGIVRVDPSRYENVPATVSLSRSSFTRHIFRWTIQQQRHSVGLLDEERLMTAVARLSRSIQ